MNKKGGWLDIPCSSWNMFLENLIFTFVGNMLVIEQTETDFMTGPKIWKRESEFTDRAVFVKAVCKITNWHDWDVCIA